jgi:hypothetical protein
MPTSPVSSLIEHICRSVPPLAHSRPTPGGEEQGRSSGSESAAPGAQPAAGRSGRTPAEPYPADGGADDSKKEPKRPADDHPWRKPFKRRN